MTRCNQASYKLKPYKSIDEFVADVAALVRHFPKMMRRTTSKKTTVRSSLIHTTEGKSLEYLANFARFVSRNPSVKVHDTTTNEAYHLELKGMFRNIRHCSSAYARTHAKIATAMKLVACFVQKSQRTKVERQANLLHQSCTELESLPLTFEPKIDIRSPIVASNT